MIVKLIAHLRARTASLLRKVNLEVRLGGTHGTFCCSSKIGTMLAYPASPTFWRMAKRGLLNAVCTSATLVIPERAYGSILTNYAVQILETKVQKLEQLVRLKDAKIQTLLAKMQVFFLAKFWPKN